MVLLTYVEIYYLLSIVAVSKKTEQYEGEGNRLYFRENRAPNCLLNSFSNIYFFVISLRLCRINFMLIMTSDL